MDDSQLVGRVEKAIDACSDELLEKDVIGSIEASGRIRPKHQPRVTSKLTAKQLNQLTEIQYRQGTPEDVCFLSYLCMQLIDENAALFKENDELWTKLDDCVVEFMKFVFKNAGNQARVSFRQ